jgi:hypothetical protein
MGRQRTCLIEVGHSTPSPERLYRAASRFRRCRAVCLLHVIASGRPAEVEAGRRVLRDAVRAVCRLDRGLVVEGRLEIGNPVERCLTVAEEIDAALIVREAHGDGEFPRLSPVGRGASQTLERSPRPVLLVSAAGDSLHRPRRAARRSLARLQPMLRPRPSSLQTPASPL